MAAAAPVLPEALATRTGTLLLALATGEVVVVVVVVAWPGCVVVGVPATVVVVSAAAEPEAAGVGVLSCPRSRTAARTNNPRRMTARSTGTLGPERSGGCGSGAEGSSTPVSLPTAGCRSKHSFRGYGGPYTGAGSRRSGAAPV